MRLAILSDIHGNLLALDAVMTDIEKQAPDDVWFGGDVGWFGPWASECIARVREAGWTCVKGNTDVWLSGDPQTVTDEQERKRLMAIAEDHAISPEDAQWLVNLPLGHSGPGSILLVHGTPASPFVGPKPDAPAAEFAAYEGQASLVVYAHVHLAFTRRLPDQTIVANTGAVGLPMDGETASYLLVDMQGPSMTLTHRRVAFDRRAAVAQSRRTGPAGERFRELMARGENG